MEISTDRELTNVLNKNPEQLKVVYFYSEGTSECEQMSDVFKELIDMDDYKNVEFFKVDAVKSGDVAKAFKVDSTPTFLLSLAGKTEFVVGADAPKLLRTLNALQNRAQALTEEGNNKGQTLEERLKSLINQAPCMLFMKGNKEVPRCGFSKQMVALLNEYNTNFGTFDILLDMEVREGLKKFSNWPTYPQLYVKGELIGGLDVVRELAENDELVSMLPTL